MVWIIEPLEIIDTTKMPPVHTGQFRLTARSDEPHTNPVGLCEHSHCSEEEARQCGEAREKTKQYGIVD